MQRLLFRDWRFALLWAIGLAASAAAFVSQGGGHEELAKSAREIKASRQAAGDAAADPAPAASGDVTVIEEEEGPGYGEPLLDTTPLDPTPKDETANAAQADAQAQP